jgi:hypothetical protein
MSMTSNISHVSAPPAETPAPFDAECSSREACRAPHPLRTTPVLHSNSSGDSPRRLPLPLRFTPTFHLSPPGDSPRRTPRCRPLLPPAVDISPLFLNPSSEGSPMVVEFFRLDFLFGPSPRTNQDNEPQAVLSSIFRK